MSQKTNQQNKNLVQRQPIVVVMGHIDHGKTTLLDYIRKENVAEKESGGITQHIGAYEASVGVKEGGERKITFIDTPGHEAFSKMRSRGARVADIAVLVVAADDGVKPQTKEALEAINSASVPFVVALNKIDRPDANAEKAKKELSENNVLIEEWGGKVPSVAISAKTGQGIDELLETILLLADLEDLKASPDAPASGVVIESHLDPKRGNAATLVIQNGRLRQGEFVVSGQFLSPVRIFEDFAGHALREAFFGQPAKVVGFNALPEVGSVFESFASRKEAENMAAKNKEEINSQEKTTGSSDGEDVFEIAPVIKADMAGSAEAVETELKKLESEKLKIRVLHSGAGSINENDVNLASGSPNSLIIGFKVKVEKSAADLAERLGARLKTFDIIYDIADWFRGEVKEIMPEKIIEKELGRAKILKVFKQSARSQIVGGRVLSGTVESEKKFRIARRGNVLGEGRIQELQQSKKSARRAEEGQEFGMKISSKIEVAPGDELEVVQEEKTKEEI